MNIGLLERSGNRHKTATYRRCLFALTWVLLAGNVVATEKEAPLAWVNAVDTNAM